MTDLIFAPPWWFLCCLFLVGGILGWVGLTKQNAGQRNFGLGVLTLAVVVLLLGIFVETDKEQVTRKSRELCKAVEKGDWSAMADLLDSDASMNTPVGSVYGTRTDLVNGAKSAFETYHLKDVTISGMDVTQDKAGCIVNLRVITNQDAVPYPTPSSWRFDWDKIGTDWHVHQITCLEISGSKTSELSRYLH